MNVKISYEKKEKKKEEEETIESKLIGSIEFQFIYETFD